MMEFEGFQKLVSRNLEFNNKSVEETLLEIGKWALLCLRIPGYFPLTICRSNFGLRLELVRWSFVTFYTVIVTILSLLGNGFFYYSFVKTFILTPSKTTSNYGNTISFIWFSLMVLVTYTTYLRLSRIFFCRGSLKFWQRTVSLIETLVSSGYQLSLSNFQKVLKNTRNWILFYYTISLIRIIFGVYWLYVDFTLDPPLNSSQMAESILDFFLCLTLCFHVGYNIWLVFLVQIITICYETIHEDLDGMTCPRPGQSQSQSQGQSQGQPESINHVAGLGLGLGTYSSSHGAGGPEERKNKTGFIQIERKIEQTIKMYENIEDHMHKFNDFFGVTLIMEAIFDLTILIVNVYAGESAFSKSPLYSTIVMGTPIVIYSSSLLHFSSDSAILSGRAIGVLKKLERFFIPNDRQEFQALQLKIIALIARVADNPPTISAAHFFTMNRHLLTSVLGTVTTYLIVLLQFRDSGAPPTATSVANVTCPENLTWTCSCGEIMNHS